jgi:hypothetical protein
VLRGGEWLNLHELLGELQRKSMAEQVRSEGGQKHNENSTSEKGKERRAHQEVSGMLREVGGGPEWPDFAGDRRGRRGYAGRCSRS